MKAVACALWLVAGVSSIAAWQSARERTIIDRAKNTDVSLLEKALPKQKFVDWVQKVTGDKAVLTWGVTDCGKQSSFSKLSDLPALLVRKY